MNEHATCLLCNSPDLRKIEGYEAFHLVKCHQCSFVFCKAIPTVGELEIYYQGYGRKDYLSPVTIKRYNELLDYFEKHRKTNNILDIGCGIGYFLEEAKKRNWNVYGTEYTKQAVEICQKKGITIHKGSLDTENYETIQFDVITSFEVIEHINTPQTETKKIYGLLRKGGLFYLTTPNFNSLSRYWLKSKWDVMNYPEHLAYYTAKNLRKLLKDSGFKNIQTKTTGFNISRIKTSTNIENTAENPISATSSNEKLRVKTENNIFFAIAKILINGLLNMLKKGDTIKGYYIKI